MFEVFLSFLDHIFLQILDIVSQNGGIRTRGLSRPGLPSPVSPVRVDIGDRGVEGCVFIVVFAHGVVLTK